MPPSAVLLNGDSLALLTAEGGFRGPDGRLLRADAAVTDPPYGFDFAADKDWDTFADTDLGGKFATAASDAAQFAEFARKWSYALKRDILKPGSHLLSFCADRTVDLLGRGLREADYAIVRMIFWIYATGQVKNPNDLRPGCEPIFVARVPTDKNLTKLHKETGRGQMHAQNWKKEDGKHPTNVLMSEEALAMDEELAARIEKGQATFYVPKPTPADRDYGTDGVEGTTRFNSRLAMGQFQSQCHNPACGKKLKLNFQTSTCWACKSPDITVEKLEAVARTYKNFHPTVKPIALMRRLIRLVSLPGHTIIDPFMGSGTTGVAAILEGRNFIGIEREPEFYKICQFRIATALREMGNEEGALAVCPPTTELPDEPNEASSLANDHSLSCPGCGCKRFMRGTKTCHHCGTALVQAPSAA